MIVSSLHIKAILEAKTKLSRAIEYINKIQYCADNKTKSLIELSEDGIIAQAEIDANKAMEWLDALHDDLSNANS